VGGAYDGFACLSPWLRHTWAVPRRSKSLRFEFSAPLLFDSEIAKGYMKHFVPVPAKVADALAESGATRLCGSLGPHAFRRTLHDRPDGSRCLKFGEGWLRDVGLREGDELAVTLYPDPDPDRVDIPDELAAALDEDPEAAVLWAAATPGRQRTLAYGVARAKRSETRARRAQALLAQLVDEAG